MASPITGFITPLRVESLDAQNWVILEDFIWLGSQGDEFVVFAGETTDFATVPWWTQSLIPKTGTWTKAAVLHDQMCNDLNKYHKLKKQYDELIFTRVSPPTDIVEPIKPLFSSVDTDAIFRKNAREGGTGVIRSELLWFGVRSGALANVARRQSFLRTLPRYIADLVVILALVVGLIAGISWAWPW